MDKAAVPHSLLIGGIEFGQELVRNGHGLFGSGCINVEAVGSLIHYVEAFKKLRRARWRQSLLLKLSKDHTNACRSCSGRSARRTQLAQSAFDFYS